MSTSPSEELTKKSPLNFSISVHILSPQPSGANFSNDFLGELRKLSEDVNNRTYKQNKMTKPGQLFDILRNTPDNIKTCPQCLISPQPSDRASLTTIPLSI